MRLTQIIAAAAIALVSTFAVADDAAEQTIRKSLANLQLDTPIESISASPMAGLYEVKLKGSRVLYASADGQYIVQGYLFQLKDG
jgi:thiol:disulfide interchange protein DsbC